MACAEDFIRYHGYEVETFIGVGTTTREASGLMAYGNLHDQEVMGGSMERGVPPSMTSEAPGSSGY